MEYVFAMCNIISNFSRTIFAFDKSVKRLSVMDSMLLKAGVLCCKSNVQDFLTVEHDDPLYSKVTHILLDPSCSGSGIVSRFACLLTPH